MFVSEANVPTLHGAKYMQQVCKHWAHNLTVDFNETDASIVFPRDGRGANWPDDGVVRLHAEPDHLACRIEASAEGQRDGLKEALARHLDRFAFREAPLAFAWTDL